MIQKILNGEYSAKLIRKRLCDVKILVSDGHRPSIEQISYDEYEEIKHLLE